MVTAIGKSLRRRRKRSAGTTGAPSVVEEVGFLLPVGLHQDAVHRVDVDGPLGTADGFDQAADTEVAGIAQDAVGRSHDEVGYHSVSKTPLRGIAIRQNSRQSAIRAR